MTRTVKKEWRGKTDNHMPPATVRQRILERANHTCHVCQGKIDKPGWHADHVPPLKDGGENREYMIKPAHDVCHRKLTAQQAIDRAPIEQMKMKASGAVRPAGKLANRGFPPSQKPKPLSRPPATRVRDVFGRPIARTT